MKTLSYRISKKELIKQVNDYDKALETALNALPVATPYDPGYKEYIALIRQSGTNAPTATILKNTFTSEVTFSRSGAGIYLVACNDFNPGKVTVNGLYLFGDGLTPTTDLIGEPARIQFMAGPLNIEIKLGTKSSSSKSFGLTTYSSNALADSTIEFYPFLLEIRIYP